MDYTRVSIIFCYMHELIILYDLTHLLPSPSTVRRDGEEIETDTMDTTNIHKSPFKIDIPWDPDPAKVDYNKIFFDHFFPDLTGKAKVLDRFLQDVRAPTHMTVVNDNIKFNRPEHDDPDHLVSALHSFINTSIQLIHHLTLTLPLFNAQLKLCITLVIAGSLEFDNGVENLWKRGELNGWKKYANFGQFIPRSYFRAFMSGFPYLFADEKYWYKNLKDMPWDLILPFVAEYNNKRKCLLEVLFLLLDESMSGCRHGTTAHGDLPNLTHEPCKPVSLGWS